MKTGSWLAACRIQTEKASKSFMFNLLIFIKKPNINCLGDCQLGACGIIIYPGSKDAGE
jgi:hypothetical protein